MKKLASKALNILMLLKLGRKLQPRTSVSLNAAAGDYLPRCWNFGETHNERICKAIKTYIALRLDSISFVSFLNEKKIIPDTTYDKDKP